MDNNNGFDMSADELLSQLKANMSEDMPKTDTRKKYKFRRSGKIAPSVNTDASKISEDEIFESTESSSDEELDIDALMKKYLPKEDYERMISREKKSQTDDEFVKTLSSIEIEQESEDDKSQEVIEPLAFTPPDTDLYDRLSEGGKVCDVPELDTGDMSDTRTAPLRPMTEEEKTIAFGGFDTGFDDVTDEEEDRAFISVRELISNGNTVMFSGPRKDESNNEDYAEEADDLNQTRTDLDMIFSVSPVQFEETDAENELEDVTVNTEETVSFDAMSDTIITEAFETSDDDTAFYEEAEDNSDKSTDEFDEKPESTTEYSEEKTETDFFETVFSGELEDLGAVEIDESMLENELFDEADFDETDANIMLAFGMDDELEKKVGTESLNKLKHDAEYETSPEDEISVKEDEKSEAIKEFVSPAEVKNVFDSYKNEYGKSALKLFALIAIAVVLFLYENIGIFGGSLPTGLNAEYYPTVYIMVGLQLLFVGFAILYKNVISGFKAFINKKPTTESYLPIMLGVSAIYSLLSCFFATGTKIISFHFPVALALVMYVVGKRLDLRREVMTFKIISSKRGKFALEKLDIIDAELEAKAFDKFLPTQPDIFRINKTSFIDGYFRRTKKYSSVKSTLTAFIVGTIACGILGAVIGAFAVGGFEGSVMTGYMAASFATPIIVFFAFSLPMFRSGKVSYQNGSAIVGESALDEYTSASSISFDDREVFPTSGVKLRSVKVFGSGRLDNVIYYMASVYSQIGGPLCDVLNVATADIGRSKEIEILELDSDGVEATVDGHHLFVGKADYLRHNGYLPVTDPEDEEIETGDVCITFLVCDDEVVGKFYVRYRIDPEFQNTLKSLYRSGICVGIKTVDPNINDEMLGTRIRLTKYPVRVLKYDDLNDRSRGSDRTDSGIVSRKSVKALLSAFTLCDKTKHITKTNLMICALSIILGLGITLAVAFIGTLSAVASIYAVLFQLFFLVPVYLISRFLLM